MVEPPPKRDVITQAPIDRLAATLDYAAPPWPPSEVPPLGHWLFTLPDAQQSELGPDGHPAGAAYAPPAYQRRMWAGGRVRFLQPLRVADRIERQTSLLATVDKPGMALVTLRHEISASNGVAAVEEQDLVYLPARAGPGTAAPKPVEVPEAVAVRTMAVDAAMLFRFSALTFNAHRIHYDRDYAMGVEHYPGLVVHGPLLAMLLIDQVRREHPGEQITSFSFRARAPVFDGAAFDLCLAGSKAWVRTGSIVAMTAELTFS